MAVYALIRVFPCCSPRKRNKPRIEIECGYFVVSFVPIKGLFLRSLILCDTEWYVSLPPYYDGLLLSIVTSPLPQSGLINTIFLFVLENLQAYWVSGGNLLRYDCVHKLRCRLSIILKELFSLPFCFVGIVFVRLFSVWSHSWKGSLLPVRSSTLRSCINFLSVRVLMLSSPFYWSMFFSLRRNFSNNIPLLYFSGSKCQRLDSLRACRRGRFPNIAPISSWDISCNFHLTLTDVGGMWNAYSHRGLRNVLFSFQIVLSWLPRETFPRTSPCIILWRVSDLAHGNPSVIP